MKPLYSVDLFAGCGGLSLGLREAGFETLLFSEINDDAADTFQFNLAHKDLIRIGSVESLRPAILEEYLESWNSAGREIDLVTGGPPCQGYSGIGHRRSHPVERIDLPSNHLFKKMVQVIKVIEPKFFLFENVRGLVSGRWTADGVKGEIWKDVRQEFLSLKNYHVGWKLVYSKDYGVPQNRPRILLVGARRDLGLEVGEDQPERPLDNPRGLIPTGDCVPPNLVDVIGDLIDKDYLDKRETSVYLHKANSEFQKAVRKPYRGRTFDVGDRLTEQEYTVHSQPVRDRFRRMLDPGTPFHKTRKFAQRVLEPKWKDGRPTITATSLPDDFVHFGQPRILTVREWARLQMFPDWFVFCGPRTTGGHRRAGRPSEGLWHRELPKYTQIGNAIPVGLATAVGNHLAKLLRGIGESSRTASAGVGRRSA